MGGLITPNPEEAGLARACNPKSAVGAVLDAASAVGPTPGYVNGMDYADWFVEATLDLLRALADLAHDHEENELADSLRRFSGPSTAGRTLA